jgi:hypothetical protein
MTSITAEELLFAHPLSFLQLRPYQTTIDEEGDEIVLPRTVWEHWVDLYPAGSPMIVEMTHVHTGTTHYACAGQFHIETNRNVYIPQWILQHIGFNIYAGETDTLLQVKPVLTPPPRATFIGLRPMDTALYHTDMRALFEQRLYTFHVLQKETTLSVYVPELGGYEVQAVVERLEPADIVVLGTEVNVEFAEPEGGVSEFVTRVPPTTEPELLTPTEEIQESAEERMARIRAAWVQKMRGGGGGGAGAGASPSPIT